MVCHTRDTVTSYRLAMRRSLSLLKWAGGKSALAPQLIAIIQKRNPARYIEPFLGSGSVFFRLQPRAAILGDTNSALMHLYLAVKREPELLSQRLAGIAARAKHLHGPAFIDFYYRCREDFSHRDEATKGALLIFLIRHCWNGLYRENSTGKFNTPIGSCVSLQALPSVSDVLEASAALQHASLQLADFERVLSYARRGDFVYLDPPYVPLSSTSKFVNYQADRFTWHDHIRLKRVLHALTERGIDFMLSNSASPGISQFYEGFQTRLVAAGRAINSVTSKRVGQSEVLVTNFSWEDSNV